MNIIPGEPIPPGFEDEVNRVAEIQSTIDTYRDNALIGIEYTVELLNDDEREPGYYCLLCDKRGDPRTILAHWISYIHRLRYLEKHFPTAIRELAPVKYMPDSRQSMTHLIAGICNAIEHHYGRLTVSVYHGDDFRNIRDRYCDEINNKYHYDEKNGPSFLNAIDREFLNKNTQTLQITIKAPSRINAQIESQLQKDRDSLDSISSDEDSQHRKNLGPCGSKKKRRSQSPAYKVLPRVRRSPPFEESRIDDKNNMNRGNLLPTPKELTMQAFQIAQERYKWEKYRCMLEIAVKALEKSLKDFEKNPEKHPLYPEEWKKFWNRRYKELQMEKKVDPNKYDYKPEWIVFWTKRMKELHADEVEEKKKQIKVNLGLNEDAEEKTDLLKQKFKIQSAVPGNTSRSAKIGAESSSNPSTSGIKKDSKKPLAVINISDDEDDLKPSSKSKSSKRSRARSRSRSRSRSLSPLSDDYRETDRDRDRDRDRRHSSYRLYERSRPRSLHYSSRSAAEYYGDYHRSHFPPPPSYGTGYRVMDPYMYPHYEKKEIFPPSKSGKSAKIEEKEEAEDDGPLTVVAVLRLLTALEEHLGSLGPKVVDLLGKALALEKVKANSADDMLVNEDNSVFFETIKEKLKGLLIADVLDDPQKVRAVKKAVKNIAAIIHQVNEKGKAGSSLEGVKSDENKKVEEKPTAKKNNKPTIADLPFDRQIVSTKLAAALVMQGREDVSTGDMDKLIYIFILLVKLSKEKLKIDGSPLQIKHVLPELGIAPQISPAMVEEIIENEVSAMVAEVDMDIETSDKEANISSASASALESLTDSDLQTLLQNFKHLSTEEQHHLIAHLKKLETADPVRVEKLRKYVNLDTDGKEPSTSAIAGSDYKFSDSSRSKRSTGNDSPRSARKDQYTDDEASRGSNVRKFIDDDDEDDDYNFEDVFKAASSNVTRHSEERSQQSSSGRVQKSDSQDTITRQQSNSNLRQVQQVNLSPSDNPPPPPSSKSTQEFKNSLESASLADTQNLIANLMGSLQQSCGQFGPTKMGGKPTEVEKSQSRNMNPSSNGNISGAKNTPPAPSSNSVPFYLQQQQSQPPQQPPLPQQHQQQQMYSNFQNMQIPQMGNYFPGNYDNTMGYPNYNYNQMQPNLTAQQLAQFNMSNLMQTQSQNPSNYNMYGGGNAGYK